MKLSKKTLSAYDMMLNLIDSGWDFADAQMNAASKWALSPKETVQLQAVYDLECLEREGVA